MIYNDEFKKKYASFSFLHVPKIHGFVASDGDETTPAITLVTTRARDKASKRSIILALLCFPLYPRLSASHKMVSLLSGIGAKGKGEERGAGGEG